MSRGRVPTHHPRNQPWRARQQQLAALVRSQQLLTGRVRQEARQLSGPALLIAFRMAEATRKINTPPASAASGTPMRTPACSASTGRTRASEWSAGPDWIADSTICLDFD